MEKVTATFDIGKTNKKFFLFNAGFKVCHEVITKLPYVKDEDGHPCESIEDLKNWVETTFNEALRCKEFKIEALNFSAYGASFIHLDPEGKPVTHLFNYTKNFPEIMHKKFYALYGPESDFSIQTGSFDAGMLNSGLQLFWLKHQHPKDFKQIKRSLHLPQYLSFLFSKQMVSDYTSIGCHTALWDYQKKGYHAWVKKEKLTSVLAPIVDTNTTITKRFKNNSFRVGVGVHDSSAALIPYLKRFTEPFILLSTGTWNVALNPFARTPLNANETAQGVLYYMQTNGSPVKAARLFLGYEYEHQVKKLSQEFNTSQDSHKTMRFNPAVYQKLKVGPAPYFEWIELAQSFEKTSPFKYSTFEEAYHHLMMALVGLQVKSLRLVKGITPLKKVFVEGGFSNNEIFLKLLCILMPKMEIYSSKLAQASSIGAALLMSTKPLPKTFLNTQYKLSKQVAPVL